MKIEKIRPCAVAPAEDHRAIARLTAALRTLEERRREGIAPPPHVAFFLGALDRKLTEDERRYVAMVFGACKDQREEMTASLSERLGIGRGGVIAGMRAHLEATATYARDAAVPRAVCEYLDRVRAQVITKAAQLI